LLNQAPLLASASSAGVCAPGCTCPSASYRSWSAVGTAVSVVPSRSLSQALSSPAMMKRRLGFFGACCSTGRASTRLASCRAITTATVLCIARPLLPFFSFLHLERPSQTMATQEKEGSKPTVGALRLAGVVVSIGAYLFRVHARVAPRMRRRCCSRSGAGAAAHVRLCSGGGDGAVCWVESWQCWGIVLLSSFLLLPQLPLCAPTQCRRRHQEDRRRCRLCP
jgi:hypothetical protein